MGRPPKGSKLPYQAVRYVQQYMNEVHRDPHATLLPKRLELVMEALLIRLQRIDKEKFEYCLRTISTIQNLDNCLFASQDRIEEEIDVEFRNLAFGEPSRKTYHLRTLQSQRANLLNYFRQHEYPTKVRNHQTRIDWIAAHWARLMETVSIIPCSCQYTLDLKEFPQEDMSPRDHKWIRPVETVNLILSKLHNTSRNNLERLFKEKSPS